MCGRFAFWSPHEAVVQLFGVGFDPPLSARYNIAPTQSVPVIRSVSGRASPVLLRWGLVPAWADDPAIGNRLINARAETLGQRPAFRDALAKRRCVVLATGFYEWRRDPGGKTPCLIARADGAPFAMAGLWARWERGGEPLETCTIVTTAANALVRPLHDRMPAILSPDQAHAWLDERADARRVTSLLAGIGPEGLRWWEVGRAVNDPRHEGPGLIAPVNRSRSGDQNGDTVGAGSGGA